MLHTGSVVACVDRRSDDAKIHWCRSQTQPLCKTHELLFCWLFAQGVRERECTPFSVNLFSQQRIRKIACERLSFLTLWTHNLLWGKSRTSWPSHPRSNTSHITRVFVAPFLLFYSSRWGSGKTLNNRLLCLLDQRKASVAG